MIDERKEIERRIRLANEFKFKTGGEYLSEDLFPKVEPARSKRPRHTKDQGVILSRRVLHCETKKARAGGIIGVYLDDRRGPTRYRATHPSGKETKHACVVDAVRAHNESFREAYPGIDAFQCDLRAAMHKWGCGCGKHEEEA